MKINLDIFSVKPNITSEGLFYISERPDQHYDWTKEKDFLLVENRLVEFLDEKSYKLALDSGCGNGRCTEPLSKYCENLIALDSSKEGLNQLQKRSINNVYPVCSAEKKLPFYDNTFDLISNITVIEHISKDDAKDFLKDHFRVLKPGGKFLIRNDAWAYGIYERYIGFKKKDGTRKEVDPTHINMITPKELKKQLINIGFEILCVAYFPFYRYGINRIPFADIFATKGNFFCRKPLN